jgi:hypothetical protein
MLRTAVLPKLCLAGSVPMDLLASKLQALVTANCHVEAEFTVQQPYSASSSNSKTLNYHEPVQLCLHCVRNYICSSLTDVVAVTAYLQPRSSTRMNTMRQINARAYYKRLLTIVQSLVVGSARL